MKIDQGIGMCDNLKESLDYRKSHAEFLKKKWIDWDVLELCMKSFSVWQLIGIKQWNKISK